MSEPFVETGSASFPDLIAFEQRVSHLQTQLADLKELARLEQLPPAQWVEAEQELSALEARMQRYLGELNSPPMAFWQVVRFGGLGFLLGILVKSWLGN
jgi:hypothetical protein